MIYLGVLWRSIFKRGKGKRIGQEKKPDEDVASGDINPQPEPMKSSESQLFTEVSLLYPRVLSCYTLILVKH